MEGPVPDPEEALKTPNPLDLLNAAQKAVPAVKYALGVAGVAAAAAIIVGLLGYGRTGFIVMGGALVAMVLLFVFARLVVAGNRSVVAAGMVLLWAVILFFCTFLFFTVTAFAFLWPIEWAHFIGAGNAADRREAAPDPALVGRWESVGIVGFGKYGIAGPPSEYQICFDIGTSGEYSRRYALDDEGVIETEQRTLQAKSRTSSAKFEVKPDGSDGLTVQALVGGDPIELKRITKPSGNPIVGRWEGTHLYDGATWSETMTISPQRNFQNHSEAYDKGKLTAQNGNLKMNSTWDSNPIVGTYKATVADKPELYIYPFGMIELKRSKCDV
jgi:hypothetical protein